METTFQSNIRELFTPISRTSVESTFVKMTGAENTETANQEIPELNNYLRFYSISRRHFIFTH